VAYQVQELQQIRAFYYVMLYLGRAGWLSADQALKASRNGFVQRQRVQQVQGGDLEWLHPMPLDPPPR